MPKYKIIQIYIVEAKNRIDARGKFTSAKAINKEDEFLEHISVKDVDVQSNGWADAVKQQLTGRSS